MRYTGNVNKFLWYFVIPALLFFFLFSRAYDFLSFNDGNRKKISNQLIRDNASLNYLDAVILGGSNSFFSLSAELLSEKTGLTWRNLSILNEGFSDKNYWEFVNAAVPSKKREKVSIVVYSSIVPLRSKLLKDRKSVSYGLEGDSRFSILPKRSIGSGLIDLIFDRQIQAQNFMYPMPNNYGDFNFSKFACRLDKSHIIFERNLDIPSVHSWMESQLNQLHGLFPHAIVYFVIPSEYSGSKFVAEISNQSNKMLFDGVQKYKDSHKSTLFFIRQSDFQSVDMLCNSGHHANEKGREWRSLNLLDAMLISNPSLTR